MHAFLVWCTPQQIYLPIRRINPSFCFSEQISSFFSMSTFSWNCFVTWFFFFSHHFTLEANQSFGTPCGVPAQLGVSRDPERYLISTLCIFLACKHALFTLCLSLPFNTMSSNYPSCNQISDCCVNLPRAVRDVNTFIQMLMCYRGNKERLAHWGEGWKGDPQCLLSAARNKWQAI